MCRCRSGGFGSGSESRYLAEHRLVQMAVGGPHPADGGLVHPVTEPRRYGIALVRC